MQNGDETDVDCGGTFCPPCGTGGTCNGDGDCASGQCEGGLCACVDGIEQFGTTNDDLAFRLSPLGAGSILVAGRTEGSFPNFASRGATDMFLAAHRVYMPVNVVQMGTTGIDVAYAATIVGDETSPVFVAGKTDTSFAGQPHAGASDAVVLAFDAGTGTFPWVHQFGTALGERAVDIVSRPGVLVVTGDLHDDVGDAQDATRSAAFVAVFDVQGDLQWNRLVNSPEPDFGRAVALAPNGDIVVVGDTLGAVANDPPAGNQDFFVARFPPNGPALWTRQFGTAFWDAATDVVVDTVGDIYVLAQSSGTPLGAPNAGGRDVYVLKLDAFGDPLWIEGLGTSSNDYGVALALHPDGGVLVAGHVIKSLDGEPAFGGWDVFAARFDADGTKLWTRQAGTAGEDRATGVAYDPFDGIFVSANTDGTLGAANAGGIDVAILHWCD
ncbi:MAG: hypothetical protein D6705_09875 [Deltaproteobacteria bacterium]|nr:MAG: hypothetical protein D6705_09875 [Deltaproteobacteria bacterium]